ncbi:MAG: 30S ribosomal protein S3 [Candidatus Moranbacteria bacterium GW2011_GWE2_35_2-]|nr:MAG: 30S ribosomal protein S3 [Candidatus Moranbacteria bacterium GW2011_GWE2_35_2-]KKQ04921.1 MAG: 30S ribosomal protein S3 [Candidatus Moranbacteria bacterium GW2011_GWF1_36_4]KKQ22925.1 MAG: 30S ribosomal protein S3 [Candidatus Moranbacteria bacterium GW2011_GWF2_37_11]KKQ29283.1 MAG: 30S ribosomal protein S3 [Candidatus Moranbacteria bacterium GW2011_GWD1_37_17]KKQ30844.1 MAG: 30S ribosomal protein S3 [Candidatus Moranbacteria bacterium GW2011_GWE1_37_24]KKQ47953.1 MAG: 30S ribosomal pr
MGKKVNPIGIRLGITTSWRSKWFGGRNFAKNLKEDVQIRQAIMKQWKAAAIADVNIERNSGMIKVIILTSRPGMLIGRGGTGIEDINRLIKQKFFAGKKIELKVEVREIRQFEENAQLVAQQVAEQLEKRMPFRRVLKSTLDQVRKNNKIKGVKIEVSGRLGGAEMSRREWLSKGTIPLHTLRADIDFSRATAMTTYGAIGVKVWIYKGEIFE